MPGYVDTHKHEYMNLGWGMSPWPGKPPGIEGDYAPRRLAPMQYPTIYPLDKETYRILGDQIPHPRPGTNFC